MKSAIIASHAGELLAASTPGARAEDPAAVAVAARELAAAAAKVGLGRLELLIVKGARATAVTAIGRDTFLHAALDPSAATAAVEKAMRGWASAADTAAPPRPPETSAPASPDPTQVFSGVLRAFSVPDLLGFLRGAQRTGVLVCSAGDRTATLRFRDGGVVGVSPPGGARQGDVANLGTTVERTLRELVGWTDGSFAFRHDDGGEEADPEARIDVQRALLDVVRQLDEEARDRSNARDREAASA